MGRISEGSGGGVCGRGWGSEREVPEESASALGLRACLPGDGSWRTNLLARGGVGAERGPGSGHFRCSAIRGVGEPVEG